MFNKALASIASVCAVATQAVTLQAQDDLIALALANSLSDSASHLVQLASALETKTNPDPAPALAQTEVEDDGFDGAMELPF